MMIGNKADFKCAIWEQYSPDKSWFAPEGTSKIYVKFRDNAGNVSEVVSDDVPLP